MDPHQVQRVAGDLQARALGRSSCRPNRLASPRTPRPRRGPVRGRSSSLPHVSTRVRHGHPPRLPRISCRPAGHMRAPHPPGCVPAPQAVAQRVRPGPATSDMMSRAGAGSSAGVHSPSGDRRKSPSPSAFSFRPPSKDPASPWAGQGVNARRRDPVRRWRAVPRADCECGGRVRPAPAPPRR